jgi:class 3 adenylate cyclase
MAPCATCGQDNPAGARFCNSCGATLQADEQRDERKIVTVLFVDLVGFTARAELLDPEDVREILQAYHTRVKAEIERFGGVVEKFIGDAVMGVFGAPAAHGDDPERAVRAAMAVREAVAAMNEADPELDLQVRVAVNTGEAIVSLGARAEAGEAMVAGDVVNTASRLQNAAPTNGILVGEETYRATRSLLVYEEAEAVTAKGKSAPLRVWLAQGARTDPGERTLSTVPMLGRENELAVLERIFESIVAEERSHLVTVLGDAGIGKTRLAAEFTTGLEEKGVTVLRGRSLPYGASTLYGPFTQVVKQFTGIFASDYEASAKTKLRTRLGDLFPDGSSEELAAHLELLMGLGTEEEEVTNRQTLFLAARRFTEGLTSRGPVVLVFEDIHWADSGTLDLLEVLASRVRGAPLLLLALTRPVLLLERPGWGGGLTAHTALSLEALSEHEAQELASLLAVGVAEGEEAARLAATSEGNPLFIEELVASVRERPDGTAAALPTSIRGLLSARLDALPAAERSVLLDAAVVGKVFWRGALERDGNGIDLDETLDALEARDLIRRESLSWIEGEEQFSFKHVMIRDAAYATLSRATRKQLHASAAAFLEEATAGAAATATALAQHWREAGEPARAVGYLVVAGDQAGRGWAKDAAARLYGEALELLPEDDVERRREVSRKRAIALVASQHVEDALNVLPRERGSS